MRLIAQLGCGLAATKEHRRQHRHVGIDAPWGAIIVIDAIDHSYIRALAQRRGCKFRAPIHTLTGCGDAQQWPKFRFWIRWCGDEKSHWRRSGSVGRVALPCSRIVVVLLPGCKEFAES